MLLQENEELGKTIASGKTAKLEGEIALQKTLVTEMKNNQSGMQPLVNYFYPSYSRYKEELMYIYRWCHTLHVSQVHDINILVWS